MESLISASVIICESVLAEKTTELISAIRIHNVVNVPIQATFAHFFVLTYLHAQAADVKHHTLQVQLGRWEDEKWVPYAAAQPRTFVYGRKVDPTAPGAFILTTEFNLDLRPMPAALGTFLVHASLDGESCAWAPLTLRRR